MTSLFGTGSRAASPSNYSPQEAAARLESLKASVRNELALQNAQELMNKVNEKCYAKCIPKPGSSLSSSEEKCLGQCMERYLDAFNIVSRAYVGRLKRDRSDLPTPP